MKTINKCRYFFIGLLLATLGFSSCSKDEQTVIVPKTVDEYKLQMNEFIASEKAKLETCEIGYNKGNFRVSSTSNFEPYKTAYLTVLNIADTVVNTEGVTIAQIVASNKTLANPGKTFNGSLFISDRRPMLAPIIAADSLNFVTTVGTAVGQVAEDAKTAYTDAIIAAKATRDAKETVDRQVADGIKKLDEATNVFQSAIIK
jgi:hypothetical protein